MSEKIEQIFHLFDDSYYPKYIKQKHQNMNNIDQSKFPLVLLSPYENKLIIVLQEDHLDNPHMNSIEEVD